MQKSTRKVLSLVGILVGTVLLGIVGMDVVKAQDGTVEKLPLGDHKTVLMGYDTFSDTESINVVAKQMLERLGYTVDAKSLDVGVLYASLADGNLDVYSGGNLPNNHKDYWAKFGSRITMLGPLHDELQIGMAAPDYVKENSIADLKGKESEFDNKVLGNTPGSGNMRQTGNAIKVYGLNMQLIESSEAAESAAIAQAISAKKPIVFAAWSPNWWWGKWKLKFLADPEHAYAPRDGVYHLVSKNFEQSAPRAIAFYKNYKMSAEQQGSIMLAITEGMKSDEAARKFIEGHPDLVKKWLGE